MATIALAPLALWILVGRSAIGQYSLRAVDVDALAGVQANGPASPPQEPSSGSLVPLLN